MELYRDFDYESDSSIDMNYKPYSQLKHKNKNTFVFESFTSKLKKLTVRLSENIDIDYSILKLNENDKIKNDEDKIMKYSNFKSLLEREFSSNNQNEEFNSLYTLLYEYSSSYVYLLNNYKKVFNILKEDIQKKIENKFWRGIFSSLDLLIALIKDLRNECYDYFIDNNLSQIVNITKIDNDIKNETLFDLIDHIFTFFVNIFKFYKNSFEGNFEKILIIYSDLLFNRNKFIRKFASQSLTYIIKNLDDKQLTKTFNFLFNFIIHPEKLFEEKDIEMINNEDFSSKNILSQKLSFFQLKIFISDCLSELLTEVLTNKNVLSNLSDIIIFKLKGIDSNLKDKNEVLLIFINTFLKLIKKVREDNKINVVCLFHYFLLTFYSNKEINFKKMKLKNLTNQLNEFDENNFSNEKILLGLILYSKELLTKNFKDNSTIFSIYINSLLEKIEKFINYNEINLNTSLIIEIYCLMLKFHYSELTFDINKILKKEEYIKFLFETINNLNLFSFYQSFSTFSLRNPNDSIDNEEYNNISYNKEIFEDIIIKIINENEIINYDLLVQIIKSYEKIFGKCEINLINKDSIINKIKSYLSLIKNNEISIMINNMNEINYDKLTKLFMISSMINEKSIINIISKEIIKYLSLFINKEVDFDEFLIHILFNDFYLNQFHYLNNIQLYLNILTSFKSLDEISNDIIKNECPYLFSYIKYYSFIKNHDINKIFSNKYSYLILLSNDNQNKINFIKLFEKYFYEKYKKEYEQNNKKDTLKEIFITMEKICKTNFDFLNDKKYNINLEIIVSQIELIISNEGITKFNLDLIIFSFFFLLGNFWITLTKSVWPIISKSIENLFSALIKSSNIEQYSNYELDIKTNLLDLINKLFIFIANFPSESDFYSKNYFRIKNEWISLKNEESIHILNINELQIKYRTISTFFNGITIGLSNYYILLNSNQNFTFDYLDNCIIKIGNFFKNLFIENIFSKPKDNTDLCTLYNYIVDKEMKSSYSTTIFKLKESLFLNISKLNSLLYYKNFDSLKKIIYEQIIISRSITIQKYSIEIISLYDNRIKNYLNLLKNIIESTTVINQIFNINNIINDNGHEIKEEEREILIPIITRLYYSKYFHLKDDSIERGKKMKTKNKINLVNYFIQLRQNEFEEYLNIVFEPIFFVFKNEKNENFNILNLKIYNKILEIIKLNLKQITNLFNNNNQISIISNKIKLCFVYLKNLGQKIKINKEDLINSTEKYINKYLSNENNILNAYDKEEFSNFFNYIYKKIKDLKKESFNIFTMIFNKFYENTNLISQISKTICEEYKENLKKITKKINSIYKFFISLSKHAKLHFIFSENSMIIENLLNIIKNEETEKSFIINIIECIENILSPYSINNINKNENITQMEISEDEESNIFNYHKNDIPIDDKTLQNNFEKIIIFNFNNFNESLTSLIFNNKIGTTIKDNLTLRIIDIFLSLWSLYTNSNKNKIINYKDLKVDNILSFLLKILEKDKKIYQERDILNNVLKLSHIFITIKIKYQSNKSNLEEMKNLYKFYISLIYKVENYNNRLIVSIILQEFSFIDPTNKLINVLELISYLNANKQKNRQLGEELDSDSVIEKINLINENFINENLSVIEPLIYQLIILSNNEDFALSTLSLDKVKLIFQKISLLNMQENFISVINVFFYLLNEKFTLAKNIMEFLYEINSKTQNKISCSDLYEIVNEDKTNCFLLNILNFKYDLRSDALDLLINYFKDSNKNISQYSIVNVIIPIIKNFLNFKNYSENPSNIKKFTLKRKNEILNEIINKSILIIPEIVKRISEEEIEKLLLYFYSNLKKLSQNKNKDNMFYSIDIYKLTNNSLTKILESIISIKFNKIQFNSNFKTICEKYINEKVEKMELKLKDNENLKEIEKEKPILNITEMYRNIFEDLNTNLIESINEFSNNNLYKIIKNQIYPQLKYLLYDEEKRKNKNSYYIRNYIIIPYLNILKILNPNNIRTEIIQLTIELVNNLKNIDTGIRIKSREGIKNVINTLGENITIIFFDNMKIKLNSGYERHVLGYTINYLLSFINNYKINEISLFLIMPILFDEIFGDISKEKEINNLVNKYKEAKNDKSLNSFELISQKISITSLILGIIIPLKNYLIIRKNTSEIIQKVNEVLNSIVKGLKSNLLINKDNKNEINNILEYSYILTNIVIEKNIQNVKEIKKMKGIEIKGNDIYTIDISEHYKIEIANKYMEEKNDILYSNLFASLGLDFILILFKKKILNLSEIIQGSDLYEKINCLINNIVICLKMSNNTILVSKAIKIIINFIEASDKFFIIKKNLNKIVKNLFKLILSINKGDTLLSQSVLNGISIILTKFTFIQIPNEKLKTCIQFLKVNLNNNEIKPYILSCILSLIKRKILHPDIYDMINYLREIYLTSFDQNTITICYRIFFEFINNYPLEKKGRMNHINYFIINCDSKTRKCKINSIKMLNNFVSKKMEGIEENYDFILLNLFTLYMNNSDSEIKENISQLINQLYENYDKNNFKSYYEKAVNFINNISKNNENQKMINLSLVMISIMLNLKFDFINNSLMNKFDNLLKIQIDIFENLIEEKMNKYDYLIKGENTIKLNNINVEDYNTLYLILICIEKANKNYLIEISNELLKRIILCLNHPHSFIKTISLRIILENSNLIKFNDDLINIITHLKFILMTNDYEDKIYEYSEQLILNFISNKLFINNDNILDLLITLCNESKKWISNKEIGLSILNRITNIFEKIVEGENNIFYFKPIIELCYRINNNNLASDEIKKKCNIIMENISSKMKKDDLTKVYKDVIKEVNFLKQKRKLEQVDNFRKKYEGKEYKNIEKNIQKDKKNKNSHQNNKKNNESI